MDSLAGRTAFVTGAAGGIGLGIAEALLAAGVRVALADIDQEELDRTVARLGPGALAVGLDVTDRAAWAAARTVVESHFGAVDILVNNAGIGPDGRHLADMDPVSFDRLIGIKLTGTFNGVSTFAASMRERGVGHIVNTASMAGLMASSRLGAYTAAKFAVVGLSEVLRAELAPSGVGVSVLCPGLVRTRLAQTTAAAGSERVELPASISATAMDPAVVGVRVVQAIRANSLYVITHPEYRPQVAARMDGILAAFDSAASLGSSS